MRIKTKPMRKYIFIVIYIYPRDACLLFSEKNRELSQNIDGDFMKHMEDNLRIEGLDIAIKRMSKGKSPGLDVDHWTMWNFTPSGKISENCSIMPSWNVFQLDTCLLL